MINKSRFLNYVIFALSQRALKKTKNEKFSLITLENAKSDLDKNFTYDELWGLWKLRGPWKLWKLWELRGLWGLWGLWKLREEELIIICLSAYEYSGGKLSELTVENIDKLQLEAIDNHKWEFDMSSFEEISSCGTTLCRAGAAVYLANQKELVDFLGWALLGAMIYQASAGYVPNFYADNKTALADMREKAGLQ